MAEAVEVRPLATAVDAQDVAAGARLHIEMSVSASAAGVAAGFLILTSRHVRFALWLGAFLTCHPVKVEIVGSNPIGVASLGFVIARFG